MNNRLVRVFASFSVLALLLALMPGQIQQASAVSPDIVISQVYGGGGNSGATLTNDFIELFNRGTVAVDITGWSVQYASASGSTWQVTSLSGAVQPGQYYLVQEAAGSGGSTSLPTPDATGSIAMSATNGKVVVANSSTALSGSAPTDASIVDVVGYGSANFFEGSAAAPGLSNTTADFRGANGCTDTDDNASDFTSGVPAPRNTSSPLNPCSSGDTAPSVTSTTPSDGATNVAIDADIEISFSENVAVSSGWFDISCTSSGAHTATESGGAMTFTLNPDVDFDNSESCMITVYAAQVTDQDGTPDNMAADYVFSFTTEGIVETPDIIITEIMYNPASAEDNWEWVEIYNAGSAPVDLTGFVIDDNNSVAHSSANIAGGTLVTGGQAILYNADDVLSSDFLAAWGTVNLIPVTDWSAMALNNSGDTIGIWDSFASYSGDQTAHVNAIENVTYTTSAPWPSSDGNASIYLTDLTADNTDGANWALSTDGGVTPLFTGYTSTAAGGNSGADVGSPGTPEVSVSAVINEFSASTTGTDVEYVEIFGTPSTDFSANTVLEIEGDSTSNMGVVDEVISLGTTDADGFYLANLAANSLENGTITLLLVNNFTGALNDDLDTNDDGTLDVMPWSTVVDAVAVNDGGSGDLTYGVPVLGPNYDGLSSFAPGGASRIPDGFDTDAATDWARNDFDLVGIPGFDGTPIVGEAYNTPGAPNELITIIIPPFGVCGDPATFIHDVQGNGLASPLAGSDTAVIVEGVVVSNFQGPNQIGGYHIQEEDTQVDADPLTSEGLYIFDNTNTPSVGDVVRVEGAVTEFNGLTELSGALNFSNCGSGGTATPATVSLPVTSVDDFEAYEGMLVTFPQPLVISEYFNFDRFGEIVLTSERHLTPTAEFEPGPDSIQAAADFLLDRITLDDGRGNQNPDPAIHPNGNVFDLTNLFRGGDTVANVTGAMDYAFGLYRIQPTQGADYTVENPRPAQPDDVGGNLKVASFNVLNYFSTIDTGAFICGPAQDQECRGADDANEFTRQRDKIIAAITAIDADVVGLLEIENNINDEAVQDLVDGLNAVNGAGTYDYVHTGVIGTDAIKVALIYKPASVSLQGDYAILDSTVDPRFIDTKNRPALAQTFLDNATGGIFTVTINHLKSKGSDCNDIGDPDTGDGSGNCNGTRTLAAQALVDWLATDPTGSGDPDFLIIGDLNSYDKEDPIDAIKAGSDDTSGTGDDYTDMVFHFQGEDAYSYVFDGQIGYLDHALGNAELFSQVTGVTDWHINADEPDLIDYDTTFKQPAQDAIYAPDPYRSSDHDPVIIGLNLAPQCNGLNATVYVGLNGKIVGGPFDGYPYQGTLVGSSSADVIVGTNSVDTIYGLNGNDVICALDGGDSIYAGDGDDVIYGGDGNDFIYASLGDDTADGGNGNDAILGSAGQDVLEGGAGQDIVDGGPGADTLAGGDQNDIVRGGIGNDELDGGGGTDLCNGGSGTDTALSCEIKILIP